MDAEKRLQEVLESLGPEKIEGLLKFAEGAHAWNTLTSEEKDKILEALRDFVEENKAQKRRKE